VERGRFPEARPYTVFPCGSGIDRPARDRTARCWLHWCRRGYSRLDPVIPGSAARSRVEVRPRRSAAVERRKASAPLLSPAPMRGRGANIARAAYAGRLSLLRRGGNQWCACRRSASLLLREARRAFLQWRGKTRMRRRIAGTGKAYPFPVTLRWPRSGPRRATAEAPGLHPSRPALRAGISG
jgi:hypothetical protein